MKHTRIGLALNTLSLAGHTKATSHGLVHRIPTHIPVDVHEQIVVHGVVAASSTHMATVTCDEMFIGMTNTNKGPTGNHVAEPSSHINYSCGRGFESLPMTYSTVLIMPPKLLILER